MVTPHANIRAPFNRQSDRRIAARRSEVHHRHARVHHHRRTLAERDNGRVADGPNLRRAGFFPWLGGLAIVPIANIVLLWFLAIAKWPAAAAGAADL
jgi:hypothetical protein